MYAEEGASKFQGLAFFTSRLWCQPLGDRPMPGEANLDLKGGETYSYMAVRMESEPFARSDQSTTQPVQIVGSN